MKIAPRSLRWRLQAWYGVLLFIVLCAFGLAAFQLEKAERHSVDADLHRRLSALVSALRAGGRGPGDAPRQPPAPNFTFAPDIEALFTKETGCYYVVWMRGPEPVARSANAPSNVPRPGLGGEDIRTRDGMLREAFLFAAPADCVLVGRSVEEEEAKLYSHATWLGLSGAVLLGLGLLGGSWLVARTLKPVEDISATAARIAAGDLSQRIPTLTSDSEIGQLVRVLNSTFAQLDAAFSEQSRFTADAAHELRTPVTVLLAETQGALSRERSGEEYRESLETCQRTAQRMRRLIDVLLELARLEFGRNVLQREKCDLAVIASECLAQVTALARDRRITTDADLSLAPVLGDPDRLTQVITNLLANAIQHTKAGGTIHVTTGADKHAVFLSVTDNGSGIAANDLPHIFERFYRADKARTSSAGNAGLGLSIAKAIVTAHGGSIEVQSEVGHGTCFLVRIPCPE
jgi:two-component system OmpR family sensor kinase